MSSSSCGYPAKLRRLNDDTSWLFQIPYFRCHDRAGATEKSIGSDAQGADHSSASSDDERVAYFNLLIDPWLADTPQIDFYAQFSLQSRRVNSALANSIQEVDEVLQVEHVAAAARESPAAPAAAAAPNGIDAVLISHPFTDHAHPDTLASAFAGQSRTPAGQEETGATAKLPIYTTFQAIGALRQQLGLPESRDNSASNINITAMDTWTGPLDSLAKSVIGQGKPSQQATFADLPESQVSLPGLPGGIKIFYLPARESTLWNGPAWQELHGAVVIAWQVVSTPQSSSPSIREPDYDLILYSPHGISPTSLPDWLLLARRRVLIHCLDRQSLPFLMGGCVALGFAKNGVKLCKTDSFNPHVYLATHDERKKASGLVAWLLKREDCSVQDAEGMLQELWQGQQTGKGDEKEKEGVLPFASTHVKVLNVGEVFHVA